LKPVFKFWNSVVYFVTWRPKETTPTKMSEYPQLSLTSNRNCTRPEFGNSEACPQFPCSHTPCHNPDWLADEEDLYRDATFWTKLWSYFRFPDESKEDLSAEELEACDALLPRCARLEEKKAEIDATIKAHKQWCEEAEQVYWQKYEESLPEDVQQQQKELWAAQKILADEIIEEARRESQERGLDNVYHDEWVLMNSDLPAEECKRLRIDDEMIAVAKEDLVQYKGPNTLDRIEGLRERSRMPHGDRTSKLMAEFGVLTSSFEEAYTGSQ
jgi:hypothetical protein